jgi:hypothetical protein
MNRLDV